MTRSEFRTAYRDARIAINTMSDWGRPKEDRAIAEAHWILGLKSRHALAYASVAQRYDKHLSIAASAIYDFRFCGGERRAWYLEMARKMRA